MNSRSTPRRDYEQSCHALQAAGWLDPGPIPPIPARLLLHDDPEPLGVTFLRMEVTGDFSNMTLPRTFFGRSEVRQASFRRSDLSESNLCWNDLFDVDLCDAILAGSDLRAAVFNEVNFAGCDLRGADLRRATFHECNFKGADLRGAKLTRSQARRLGLSKEQGGQVLWEDSEGEEPRGG